MLLYSQKIPSQKLQAYLKLDYKRVERRCRLWLENKLVKEVQAWPKEIRTLNHFKNIETYTNKFGQNSSSDAKFRFQNSTSDYREKKRMAFD